jgi:hypothetical protein
VSAGGGDGGEPRGGEEYLELGGGQSGDNLMLHPFKST